MNTFDNPSDAIKHERHRKSLSIIYAGHHGGGNMTDQHRVTLLVTQYFQTFWNRAALTILSIDYYEAWIMC